ncbi:MAG: hypothetical protein K0R72_1260 [Clostridia bacterium]|jgi:hypothetical protein|nr:hypothetical protein [Clostridia bacterium]
MKNNKKVSIIFALISLICIIILLIYFINTNSIIQDEYKEILKISKYNNPLVPTGFKKVESEIASWEIASGVPKGWSKGLVIEDEIGNQFVWIPINIDKSEYIVKLSENIWDDSLPSGINDEYNQIKRNGGFYISRYEAGVSNEMQLKSTEINNISNNVIGRPVSKPGVRPWNYISYKQAKENAQSMYSNEYIQSGLMTYSQWNCINLWLDSWGYSKGGTVQDWGYFKYGNFLGKDTGFTGLYSIDNGISYLYGDNMAEKPYRAILSSGASQKYFTNNIYDIYGNLSELTTRYGKGYCTVTGGDYNNVSNDWITQYVEPSSRIGFRVVIYLK